MKVHPHTGDGGCGGGTTTAKIMINDNVSVCHTKAIRYPTGRTAVWKSDDQLQDCAKKEFNSKGSKIFYTIQPTDNDRWYCVVELVVIFDDQQSTKYMALPAAEWRQGELSIEITEQ